MILSNNDMDDNCMNPLGDFIQSCDSIESIFICGDREGKMKITDKGIEILAPYIYGNKSLSDLRLSSIKTISNDSIPYLSEIIEKSNIQRIDFYGTSISSKGAIIIPFISRKIKNGTLETIDYAYL